MRLKHFYLFILTIVSLFVTSSCSKDEPDYIPPKDTSTSILLYAVASNNLYQNYLEDLDEIKIGLKGKDLDEINFYIYSVTPSHDIQPTLYKAVTKEDGNVDFKVIKQYDRSISSVNPERISEVINDYSLLSQAPTKGLILWSHSTAWSPTPDTLDNLLSGQKRVSRSVSDIQSVDRDDIRWWGQDIDGEIKNYCDLPELASAIPDNYFDFIWFDCCYMSSIEVIYEMKDKAKMFVAYPTEVLAEGAPYELILPYIAVDKPDLIGAASAMSDYYLEGNKYFTLAVIDPSPIEEIADMAQTAIPGERIRSTKLLKYSRPPYFFYDFGQYTDTWGASLGETWDPERFHELMDKLVVYKNCGSRLFDGRPIEKENFSGVSCCYFNYNPEDNYLMDEDQLYYINLQWFKRVFEPYWPEMNQ